MSQRSAISPSQTSFAEGFHVRTLVPPDEGPGSRGSAPASGGTSPPSSTKSARAGSSSKTSRRVHADGCPRCGVICTCLDTIRPPTRFLPPMSERHILGSGSSLLPTPLSGLSGSNLRGEPTLVGMARKGKWPTPTVSGNYNRKGASLNSGDGLATAAGGPLNPGWVEWLMGFPEGWTDCEPSATPLCRNARK